MSNYHMNTLLTVIQQKKLNQWKRSHTKPLLLIGHNGCGKSTIATQCLSNYHCITIGIDFVKTKCDLISHIKNSLTKQDILQMVLGKPSYKALIVDDIQHFAKQDKANLQKIINYVKQIEPTRHPVIFVCNEYEDKLTKQIYSMCEVLKIQFNLRKYKSIFKNTISDKQIKQSKSLSELQSNLAFKQSFTIDKQYDIQELLHQCFTKQDLFELCCSEYTIVSLNLLENISHLIKELTPSVIFAIYQSICIDDSMQTKYLPYDLPNAMYCLYSCVIPKYYMKSKIPSHFKFKYNSYVSRSIIQIHHQQLTYSQPYDLLDLLYRLYMWEFFQKEISKTHRFQLITTTQSILEKQLKSFNYVYNKAWTKPKLKKAIKNLHTIK